MVACSSLITNSTINSSIAYLYSSENGSWPPQSAIAAEVSDLFQTVCATGTFQSLVSAWGGSNVSFGFVATTAGPQVVNFSISWTVWQSGTLYADSESWQGNIPEGTVAGPFFSHTLFVPSYGSPVGQANNIPILGWIVVALTATTAVAVGIAGAMRRFRRDAPGETGAPAAGELSTGTDERSLASREPPQGPEYPNRDDPSHTDSPIDEIF
jgi:hypothetical protein